MEDRWLLAIELVISYLNTRAGERWKPFSRIQDGFMFSFSEADLAQKSS